MATLSRRVSRSLLQTQLRTYASHSGFKRKTGIRDGDGASDVPGEQPTGRRRRDTVRPCLTIYPFAHNRSLGVSSDANFPVDPPTFSTRPSQSPHTPALSPGRKITASTFHFLTFTISPGNNHTCGRLPSTQIPSQRQGPLPDIWSSSESTSRGQLACRRVWCKQSPNVTLSVPNSFRSMFCSARCHHRCRK